MNNPQHVMVKFTYLNAWFPYM